MLETMASARSIALPALLIQIDEGRDDHPLASACRLAALRFASER